MYFYEQELNDYISKLGRNPCYNGRCISTPLSSTDGTNFPVSQSLL